MKRAPILPRVPAFGTGARFIPVAAKTILLWFAALSLLASPVWAQGTPTAVTDLPDAVPTPFQEPGPDGIQLERLHFVARLEWPSGLMPPLKAMRTFRLAVGETCKTIEGADWDLMMVELGESSVGYYCATYKDEGPQSSVPDAGARSPSPATPLAAPARSGTAP